MTTNPTSAVNPSAPSMEALASWPDPGPIAMLNLLRYDGEVGRVAYQRYAETAARSIAAVGGSLIYVGQVIAPTSWDTVALVYYPRRRAYLDMQLDQRYIDAIPDRTTGLAARLLYPFALDDGTVGSSAAAAARSGQGAVTEIELRRWSSPGAIESEDDVPGTDEPAAMRLLAGGPGLVSDGRWDEVRLRHHASRPSDLDGGDAGRTTDSAIAEIQVVLSTRLEDA